MVAKVTVGSRQRRLTTPPGLPPDHVAGCPLDLFLAPNPAKKHNHLPVPVPAPVPDSLTLHLAPTPSSLFQDYDNNNV